MFNIFLAFFLAFAHPSHNTSHNCTQATTQFAPEPDSGGDGGHIDPDKGH